MALSTSTVAGRRVRVALRALRPHQWSKNALLFLPLLTAHLYTDRAAAVSTLLAIVAFSAVASSAYILNDLRDLEADRAHPRKRNRPFAADDLSPRFGIALAAALFAGAIGLAATSLPAAFLAILVAYFAATCIYSMWLKRISTIDVVALAGLYTLRVLAGAAAISVVPSFWLLAFSMFLFLSLAYAKRYEELRAAIQSSRAITGRNYAADDAESMFILGSISGVASVLVMALYINSPEVSTYYKAPQFLWVLCLALLYWINRLWIGARRGKIHEDPVVFALTDHVSLATGFICLAVVFAAHFIRL